MTIYNDFQSVSLGEVEPLSHKGVSKYFYLFDTSISFFTNMFTPSITLGNCKALVELIYLKATDKIIKRFIEARRANDEENHMRIAEKVKSDRIHKERRNFAALREELAKELSNVKSKLNTLNETLDALNTVGSLEMKDQCIGEIRNYKTRIDHLTRELSLLDKKLSRK